MPARDAHARGRLGEVLQDEVVAFRVETEIVELVEDTRLGDDSGDVRHVSAAFQGLAPTGDPAFPDAVRLEQPIQRMQLEDGGRLTVVLVPEERGAIEFRADDVEGTQPFAGRVGQINHAHHLIHSPRTHRPMGFAGSLAHAESEFYCKKPYEASAMHVPCAEHRDHQTDDHTPRPYAHAERERNHGHRSGRQDNRDLGLCTARHETSP